MKQSRPLQEQTPSCPPTVALSCHDIPQGHLEPANHMGTISEASLTHTAPDISGSRLPQNDPWNYGYHFLHDAQDTHVVNLSERYKHDHLGRVSPKTCVDFSFLSRFHFILLYFFFIFLRNRFHFFFFFKYQMFKLQIRTCVTAIKLWGPSNMMPIEKTLFHMQSPGHVNITCIS